MRLRLLLAIAAVLVLAGCGDARTGTFVRGTRFITLKPDGTFSAGFHLRGEFREKTTGTIVTVDDRSWLEVAQSSEQGVQPGQKLGRFRIKDDDLMLVDPNNDGYVYSLK